MAKTLQFLMVTALDRHSKQARNERNLSCDVSFVYPLHLPSPHRIPVLKYERKVHCGKPRPLCG